MRPQTAECLFSDGAGLRKSSGWTGVGSIDYIIDWYLWACLRLPLLFAIVMTYLALLSTSKLYLVSIEHACWCCN